MQDDDAWPANARTRRRHGLRAARLAAPRSAPIRAAVGGHRRPRLHSERALHQASALWRPGPSPVGDERLRASCRRERPADSAPARTTALLGHGGPLEAGEHLRAVADHLGHADTAVTDRTYTHTVRRVQDTTALRVADLIASKRGGGGKRWAADGRQDWDTGIIVGSGGEDQSPAEQMVGVRGFEPPTPSPPD